MEEERHNKTNAFLLNCHRWNNVVSSCCTREGGGHKGVRRGPMPPPCLPAVCLGVFIVARGLKMLRHSQQWCPGTLANLACNVKKKKKKNILRTKQAVIKGHDCHVNTHTLSLSSSLPRALSPSLSANNTSTFLCLQPFPHNADITQ